MAERWAPTALACIFQRRLRPREAQDTRIDQRVVYDEIGTCEGVQRQGGEQPRITGTGPDKPDAARVELGQTKKRIVDQRRPVEPEPGFGRPQGSHPQRFC